MLQLTPEQMNRLENKILQNFDLEATLTAYNVVMKDIIVKDNLHVMTAEQIADIIRRHTLAFVAVQVVNEKLIIKERVE